MKQIPLILSSIVGVCILVLVAIDISTPPLTHDEKVCVEAGYPINFLSVKECAKLLQIERDILRLKENINKIKKLINPGINI